MRFVIAGQGYGVIDLQQKSDIKMLMTRVMLTRVYGVNIDIKNRITNQSDMVQCNAGLFRGLGQNHPYHIRVPISMTAGGQPEVKLSVMEHQNMGAEGVEYPCGGGYMSGAKVAIEARLMLPHKLDGARDHRTLFNIRRPVENELLEELPSVHTGSVFKDQLANFMDY